MRLAGGEIIGMEVERTAAPLIFTRYFHKDHPGSISVTTDELGAVLERLSGACPAVGTGTGKVRSMMASNARRRDQIVPILPLTGCVIAQIGTLRIARRPARWCGSCTIITSHAPISP